MLFKGIPVWRRGVVTGGSYSLILLRTHADESDGTVRETEGMRERE